MVELVKLIGLFSVFVLEVEVEFYVWIYQKSLKKQEKLIFMVEFYV